MTTRLRVLLAVQAAVLVVCAVQIDMRLLAQATGGSTDIGVELLSAESVGGPGINKFKFTYKVSNFGINTATNVKIKIKMPFQRKTESGTTIPAPQIAYEKAYMRDANNIVNRIVPCTVQSGYLVCQVSYLLGYSSSATLGLIPSGRFAKIEVYFKDTRVNPTPVCKDTETYSFVTTAQVTMNNTDLRPINNTTTTNDELACTALTGPMQDLSLRLEIQPAKCYNFAIGAIFPRILQALSPLGAWTSCVYPNYGNFYSPINTAGTITTKVIAKNHGRAVADNIRVRMYFAIPKFIGFYLPLTHNTEILKHYDLKDVLNTGTTTPGYLRPPPVYDGGFFTDNPQISCKVTDSPALPSLPDIEPVELTSYVTVECNQESVPISLFPNQELTFKLHHPATYKYIGPVQYAGQVPRDPETNPYVSFQHVSVGTCHGEILSDTPEFDDTDNRQLFCPWITPGGLVTPPPPPPPPSAKLNIAQYVTSGAPSYGNPINVRVTVTNTGNRATAPVKVTGSMDFGGQARLEKSFGGGCTQTPVTPPIFGQPYVTYACNIPSIAAGATWTGTMQYTIIQPANFVNCFMTALPPAVFSLVASAKENGSSIPAVVSTASSTITCAAIGSGGGGTTGGGGTSGGTSGGTTGGGGGLLSSERLGPIGNLDGAASAITGWTCDSDSYNTALEVHFYKDGPAGVGTLFKTLTANLPREQAVSNACNGRPNHGFQFVTPQELCDGQTHTVYAYGINIGPNGTNRLLNGAPKTVQCPPPTVAPAGSPIGAFDNGSPIGVMGGWTCDPDISIQALEVHFYKDGKYGQGGTLFKSVIANNVREQAVANLCGNIQGHGFHVPFPSNICDGQLHKVYAYAINAPGTPGDNVLLPGGPRDVQCTNAASSSSVRSSSSSSSANSTSSVSPGNGVSPQGTLENGNSQQKIVGWACDKDQPATPIQVQFYITNELGQNGTFLQSVVANVPREIQVSNACGGNANHGFSFDYPPALCDGQTHYVSAYAINIEGTGGQNTALFSSPRLVECQ